METPRKFIIAKLLICKLRSSTDEDPSLRIESLAIIDLRGVSIKLYFNLIFIMQTYKEQCKTLFTIYNYFMVSVFRWPDPNTAFDQSEHTLYTCYLILLLSTLARDVQYNENICIEYNVGTWV